MGVKRGVSAPGSGVESKARVALGIEVYGVVVTIHREHGQVVGSGVERMGALHAAIAGDDYVVGIVKSPFTQQGVGQTVDRCCVCVHLDPSPGR